MTPINNNFEVSYEEVSRDQAIFSRYRIESVIYAALPLFHSGCCGLSIHLAQSNQSGIRRDTGGNSFVTKRGHDLLELLNKLPRGPVPRRERIRGVLTKDLLELLGCPAPLLPLSHQQTDRLEERRGFQLGQLLLLVHQIDLGLDHLIADRFACRLKSRPRFCDTLEIDACQDATSSKPWVGRDKLRSIIALPHQ
jgi:hypothetical protein